MGGGRASSRRPPPIPECRSARPPTPSLHAWSLGQELGVLSRSVSHKVLALMKRAPVLVGDTRSVARPATPRRYSGWKKRTGVSPDFHNRPATLIRDSRLDASAVPCCGAASLESRIGGAGWRHRLDGGTAGAREGRAPQRTRPPNATDASWRACENAAASV